MIKKSPTQRGMVLQHGTESNSSSTEGAVLASFLLTVSEKEGPDLDVCVVYSLIWLQRVKISETFPE